MSHLPRFLVFLSSRAMPHSGSTRPTNKTKSGQPFLQSYNAPGEAKISSERNKSFSRRKQSVSPHETKCFTRMEQSVSRAWNNVCHRHGTNEHSLQFLQESPVRLERRKINRTRRGHHHHSNESSGIQSSQSLVLRFVHSSHPNAIDLPKHLNHGCLRRSLGCGEHHPRFDDIHRRRDERRDSGGEIARSDGHNERSVVRGFLCVRAKRERYENSLVVLPEDFVERHLGFSAGRERTSIAS